MKSFLTAVRREEPPARERRPPFWRVGVLSFVLCSLSLLVPIDRGFPKLSLVGLPFRWPFVVTGVTVVVLLAWDPRRIRRILSSRYCLGHACVVAVFLVGAFRSPLVVTAFGRILAYVTAYVFNFIVLTWIFERGGRKTFVAVLCGVAVTAAALGLAEGIFSFRPPIYGQWLANYDDELGWFEVGSGGGYRANGTLGNPILYAMAMLLCIPFVAEIRSVFLKWSAILLLLGAAAFTISKVVVVAALPLIAWGAWQLGLRRVILWFAVLTAATLAYQYRFGTQEDAVGAQLRSRWIARLLDPATMDVSVGARAEIAALAVSAASNTAASVAVGHGMLSESEVSQAVLSNLGTIDNTYVNIYYETGLIGLVAYLFAFAGPLWHLRHLRRLGRWNIHYAGIVSLLAGSVVFVSYHYYTFNFVATASMASLYYGARQNGNATRAIPGPSSRSRWPASATASHVARHRNRY